MQFYSDILVCCGNSEAEPYFGMYLPLADVIVRK